MLNPTYLQLSRQGIFYLRWPIPKHVHPEGRPSTMKLSLRTREPRQALRLSRLMGNMADALIDGGYKQGMRYEEIRSVLKAHFQNLLKRHVERVSQSGRTSERDRTALINGVGIADEAIATGSTLSLTEATDDATLERIITMYELPIVKGSPQYRWLRDELKISYRDFGKAALAYDASLNEYDFAVGPQSSSKIVAEADSLGMSLNELTISYVQEKKLGRNWVAKTELEKSDHIELLKEILGADIGVATVTAKEVRRVKDTLLAYPKNRSKNPRTRGKSLVDVLTVPNVQKLEVATINKYLQTYNDLFEWAKRNGHTGANHFSGLTIRHNKQRAQNKREAFSDGQVRMILAAVFENRDGMIRKDYQKWGPLIGVYTGARLNEIAQILLSDVRQHEGIWCFDLNDDGDDKQLKTSSSKRLVPIHRQLIDHGLLAHVEGRRRAGQSKLFTGFTYCPKNGWGRNLGRWFNETLLPELDLKRKELVFHSLRHTVVTRLMQSGVPEPIVKALVGHAQQGVTQQNYFKEGYTLRQLDEALQKLDFSLPLASDCQ